MLSPFQPRRRAMSAICANRFNMQIAKLGRGGVWWVAPRLPREVNWTPFVGPRVVEFKV